MGRPRKTRPADGPVGPVDDPSISGGGVFGRRALLAGTAASSLLAADVVLGGPARAATTDTPAAGGDGSLHLCVVTDTHVDVDEPDRLVGLRSIFASIDRAEPDVVLHCGDISDYGASDEYAAYLSAIPRSLRPRVRHVPGNHEVRWDEQALHTYNRLFGSAPYSFDVDGVHLIGLNPTQLLQEPGYFGDEHLGWLRADLAATGRHTPVVMFVHYPMGGDSYYVNDQDDFLDTISGYDVRALIAGHTHRQAVAGLNGFVQLTGAAGYQGPSYYDIQRVNGDDGGPDRLEVDSVTVAGGGESRSAVVAIPLSGPRVGGRLTPTWTRVREGNVTLEVAVRAPARAQVRSVTALVYPQATFGHQATGSPTPLAGSDGHFTGTLDLAGLPAGEHRVTVRTSTVALGRSDGFTHEQTKTFTVPSGGAAPRVAWSHGLPGSIQAALAISPHKRGGTSLVAAATTSGRVEAIMVTDAGFLPEWQVTVGPVYRSPAFSADGRTLVLGDADGTLHALDADTGASRWRANLGSPVLGSPAVIRVGGRELVVVPAGRHLHARDLSSGTAVWSNTIGGFSAGRVGFDGSRLFTGSGDGSAHALSAIGGERLWSTPVADRDSRYLDLIYGPWDDTVAVLPGGLALVSTVSSARALRTADGTPAWTLPGSYLYTPSTLIPSSTGARDLLMIEEFGKASRVDAATGVVRWAQTDATAGVPRALNGGPVLRSGRAWLLGTTGLLASFRLADGAVEVTHQLSAANSFSTPVLHGSTLVTGDQAGRLRGIALP